MTYKLLITKTLFQKQQPPKTSNEAIITLIPKKRRYKALKILETYIPPMHRLQNPYQNIG